MGNVALGGAAKSDRFGTQQLTQSVARLVTPKTQAHSNFVSLDDFVVYAEYCDTDFGKGNVTLTLRNHCASRIL